MHDQAADVGRKAQGHRRHVPGNVADVVRAAGNGKLRRFADVRKLARQAARIFIAHQFLQGARVQLVVLAPGRHADLANVRIHRQRDGPVEMPRMGGAHDAAADAGIGHHRRALGDAIERFVIFHDAVRLYLAHEVPDAGIRRHDVRLIAAVVDHVMRALQRVQVLAPVVPADVEQFDGVEGAAARPGVARAVGRDAVEHVFDRNQPGAARVAPAHAHGARYVREQHGVDVVEQPFAGVPRLGAEQFLGDAGPDFDRTRQILTLHDFLDRQSADDHRCQPRVMAFAMARGALDHRLPVGHSRHLGSARNAVHVRADGDHRLAFAPARPPGRRHAGHAQLDFEPVRHEQFRQVALSLEFLEAEFGE